MAAAAAAASTETLAKKDGVDKAKFSPQGMRSKNIGDAGSLSPRSTGGVGGGMSAISSDVAGESDAIISGQMRALSLQRKDSEIRLEASENEDWRASEREIEVISEAKARDSLLGPCRASYAYAVLSCPQNLRWKVRHREQGVLLLGRLFREHDVFDTIVRLIRIIRDDIFVFSYGYTFMMECSKFYRAVPSWQLVRNN